MVFPLPLFFLLFAGFSPETAIPTVAGRSFDLFVFEGSDWCMHCRQLENQVLADSALLTFLKEKDIRLTRVDFPQRRKLPPEVERCNDSLAVRYGFDGVFPTLVLSRTDTVLFSTFYYQNDTPGAMQNRLAALVKQLQ